MQPNIDVEEIDESSTDHHRGYPLPIPIELPVPDRAGLRRRFIQTMTVAGKHMLPVATRKVLRRDVPERAMARALRLTFEELGATYVKFGQLLGSSHGVWGEEVSNEFRTCLDTGPAVPFWMVRRAVRENLGAPIEEIYAEFDTAPLAAASIAVVHKAVLKDGRTVAVKVLRPHIDEVVATDLDLMQPLFEVLTHQIGVGLAGPLLEMLSGFREQVAEELDLRNEMAAMIHHRKMLDQVDLPRIVVPEPFPELTGRSVMNMEFLDGVPIDDLAAIAEFGVEPRPLVEEIVRGWFMTAVRNGTFHGDVHAGNLLFLRDGRMGVIDWGIVGRLSPSTHQFLRWVIEAALGDETAWEKIAAHIEQVYGPALRDGLGLSQDEVVDMIRSQMEPLLTKPFGEVSLGDMITGPQGRMAEAQGQRARRQTVRGILKHWRETRRLRNLVAEHESYDRDFDRGTFLLGKQLMYFERYGKMFLSDVALLSDRDFFEGLLRDDPIDA